MAAENPVHPRPRLQAGGNLRDDALYVERAADGEFYRALQRGEVCYVLAPRQMGKSSLCARTARRLRSDGIRCPVIDLNRIGGSESTQGADRWFYSLIKELARKLDFPRDFTDQFWERHSRETLAYRFTEFLRAEVLNRINGKVVFLFDEIDTVLGLPFSIDDFFAAVRDLYNARNEQPELARLSFGFIGVATPGDLMRDAARTPFNIGRGILLDDFTRHEARAFLEALQPLESAVGDAQIVLDTILGWTNGHPYMTHKICEAVGKHAERLGHSQQGAALVDMLVKELFLEHGRTDELNLQYAEKRLDAPTNRDRLTALLRLYRRVLQGESIAASINDPLQAELRLGGMVRFDDAQLKPRNRIFSTVYDLAWVHDKDKERFLDDAIERWNRGGKKKEDLLRGKALSDAQAWADGRSDLTSEEQIFLRMSLAEQSSAAARRARLAILIALVGILASSTIGFGVAFYNFRRVAAAERRERQAVEAKLAAETKERQASDRLIRALHGEKEQAEAREKAERERAEGERLRAELERSQRESSELLLKLKEESTVQVAEGAKKDREKAALALAKADSEKELRERSEAEQVPLLLNQPGRRLDGLARGLQLIAQADAAGKSRPAPLLQSLMQIAPELVISEPLVHPRVVNSAVYSADGNYIATACSDGSAYIWDSSTRKLTNRLSVNNSPVRVVAFRRLEKQDKPKNKTIRYYVATGSEDGTVAFFDVTSGQAAWKFNRHSGEVRSLDFSPDGRYIISSGADRLVFVYDLMTGIAMSPFGPMKAGGGSARFLTSDIVLGLDNENNMYAWQLSSRKNIQVVPKKSGPVFAGSQSQREQKSQERKPTKFLNRNMSLFMDEKGAIASRSFMFDAPNKDIIEFRDTAISKYVGFGDLTFAVAARGRNATLSGHSDGTIRILGGDENRVSKAMLSLEGHSGPITSIATSTNDQHQYILTTGSDNYARIWNLWKGRGVLQISQYDVFYDFDNFAGTPVVPGNPDDVAFQDERMIAIDYGFRKWYQTKKYHVDVFEYPMKGPPIYSKNMIISNNSIVRLSSRGTFATLANRENSKVEIWDISERKSPRLHSVLSAVDSLVFSEDDRSIVYSVRPTKENPHTIVQDLKTSTQIARLPNSAYLMRMSYDGQKLAAATDSEIVIWDLKTHKKVEISVSLMENSVANLRFSRDGKYLAEADRDRSIRIFNVTDGSLVRVLNGHDDSIYDIEFTANTSGIISAGSDGRVMGWSMHQSDPVFEFKLPRVDKSRLILSPGGERVLASNVLYPATPEAFFQFACNLLRNIPDKYRPVAGFCARYR